MAGQGQDGGATQVITVLFVVFLPVPFLAFWGAVGDSLAPKAALERRHGLHPGPIIVDEVRAILGHEHCQ